MFTFLITVIVLRYVMLPAIIYGVEVVKALTELLRRR
jgi:hypothetical protein